MKKFVLALLNVLLLMVIEIPMVYPQGAPLPFRIGGTVTIDGVQITQATDDGILIRVTKPDGTNYADVNGNAPEDKDGLSAKNNWYMIDIPIYKATVQPKGATPGETAAIHVYKNSQELRVTNPPNGQITIGGEGTSSQIDLTITTTTTETVSTPSTPSGPTSGTTGTSYSYSSSGSVSSLGHQVEYQFDWKGDGSDLSPWGLGTRSKTWTLGGTYNVKARARCASDTSLISSWSGALTVSITFPGAETVSTPNTPTGTTSGGTGTSYTYSTGGASSSLGHSVEYRFDWGDGTYSTWSSSASASKSWSSAGTYAVKAQARCSSHTSVVSGWSGTVSVDITEITEDCKYFHEDFSGPSTNSWTYARGNWYLQGGKLNVDQIDSGYFASAESSFLPSDYFTVDVDVEVVSPGQGGAYGVYPFTTGDVLIEVDGRTVDGVAAVIFVDSGNAYLLGWDVSAEEWYQSEKLSTTAPVTSIGVAYSSDAITLRINKQNTSLKFSGNFVTAPLVINRITLYAQGTGTHVHFDNVCADPLPNLPNLTPYQPSNPTLWSDKVVVSNVTETHTDSGPLYTTDELFVDFAVVSDNNVAITSRFYVALYVDGVFIHDWYWDSLPSGYHGKVEDYSIGSLSAGTHTIKIVADSENAIDESNESDNEYTKTITVTNPNGPDLTGEWISVNQSCKTTKKGKSCKITGSLKIENIGNRDAPSSYVEIYVFVDIEEHLIKRFSTGKLKAKKSKTWKISYTLPAGESASGGDIYAFIDMDEEVEEQDETNNLVIYTIP